MSTFNFCIKGDADAFGFKLKGAQPPPEPEPEKPEKFIIGRIIPNFKVNDAFIHMITGRITPREET